MATAIVACGYCYQYGLPYEDTITYPKAEFPDGSGIKWEHSCPRYIFQVQDGKAVLDADNHPVPVVDADGNMIAMPPYVGIFTVPRSLPNGS
jgi:hypothetical protein